tara:strand:+ start:973 stop:2616 length:1644 start_codon:yes stop_codon:yes gene_type:complete
MTSTPKIINGKLQTLNATKWPNTTKFETDSLGDADQNSSVSIDTNHILSVASESWPDPLPLNQETISLPFPVDSMPDVISEAVEEVRRYMQAPTALIAASALTSASIATQACFDVQRDRVLQGPSSLFLLTIAESGERKSSCDKLFSSAIDDFEREVQQRVAEKGQEYDAKLMAWNIETKAIESGIKAAVRSRDEEEKKTWDSRLLKHHREKPKKTRIPKLIYCDTTAEALASGLGQEWPSAAIISNEGSIIFGSYGMNNEKIAHSTGFYCTLWDGGSPRIDRRTSNSFTVRDARLTIGIQVQLPIIRDFICRTSSTTRGGGFLSRFLIAWPQSTQGTRLYVEPPLTNPCLDRFNSTIAMLMKRGINVHANGGVATTMLSLSDKARSLWIDYANETEKQLLPYAELASIRDLGSKSAENIARLACIFQALTDPDSREISLGQLENATRLGGWYLNESLRFFEDGDAAHEEQQLLILEDWLRKTSTESNTRFVLLRDINRLGPTSVRRADARDRALQRLEKLNRIRIEKEKNTSRVLINPRLIAEGES